MQRTRLQNSHWSTQLSAPHTVPSELHGCVATANAQTGSPIAPPAPPVPPPPPAPPEPDAPAAASDDDLPLPQAAITRHATASSAARLTSGFQLAQDPIGAARQEALREVGAQRRRVPGRAAHRLAD